MKSLNYYIKNIIFAPIMFSLGIFYREKKITMKKEKIEKILLICLSGIGNYIMATPVIEPLKKQCPNAKLDLLVRSKVIADLASKDPNINEIFCIKKEDWLSLLKVLRRKQYDISLSLFPSGIIEGFFSRIIRPKYSLGHSYKIGFRTNKIFYDKAVMLHHEHDTESNLRLLTLLDIDGGGGKQKIYWNEEDEKNSNLFFRKIKEKKIIGMHPGSNPSQKWKRWPVEYYRKLIILLKKKYNVEILIFLGPDELELERGIIDGKIVKNKEIGLTCSIIEKCNLFISNDSSLLHIANAVEIPAIGIFGPTDKIRTSPVGKRGYVVSVQNNRLKYDISKPFTKEKEAIVLLRRITPSRIMKTIEKNNLL